MSEPSFEVPKGEKPTEERLDSWKEIATYLGRDVTTVQRWEKRERMPVHRHLHDKRGSVYASRPELDAWARSRNIREEEEEEEKTESGPDLRQSLKFRQSPQSSRQNRDGCVFFCR